MNDRLKDLRGANAGDVTIDISGGKRNRRESNGARPEHMQGFFSEVDRLKEDIATISANTKSLNALNEKRSLAVSGDQEKEISNELESVVSQTNRIAMGVKNSLQRIKEENTKLNSDKPSEKRIRENVHRTLTRKFVEVIKQYQDVQAKYKTDVKKKIQRQVRVVKPEATQEEIDAVLQSGDTSQLVRNAILRPDNAVLAAYEDATETYRDVLKLEASIAELHQMFLDLAFLVEQQGELLDRIDVQVQSAADYVEQGNLQMEKALDYQRKARRNKCMLLAVCLVVLGVFTGAFTAF